MPLLKNAGQKAIEFSQDHLKMRTMKRLNILSAALVAVAAVACGDSGESENNAVVLPQDSTGTATDVQYQRVISAAYVGVIPCADCDGINTELTLFADTSYQLVTEYLGKNPKDTAGLNATDTGRYMMHNDTLHLVGAEAKYLKTDTALIQLDKSGTVTKGKQAEKYVLKKVK
jgi:uncharacterized lipoprotein NlpE involved in copper resistance